MKTLITPADIYPNKTVVIYPNNVMVIYLNEAANLLELKNQWGIRFSHSEIFKRLGKVVREMADRLIYSAVNGEP